MKKSIQSWESKPFVIRQHATAVEPDVAGRLMHVSLRIFSVSLSACLEAGCSNYIIHLSTVLNLSAARPKSDFRWQTQGTFLEPMQRNKT